MLQFALIALYGSSSILAGERVTVTAKVAHNGIHKMAKTPNIKKSGAQLCSRYPKEHLYKKIGQLGHFPRNENPATKIKE